MIAPMTRRLAVSAAIVGVSLTCLTAAQSGDLPERLRLTEIGAPEGGLPVISDLPVFDDRLWLIESRVPLDTNGAAIWTYDPAEGFGRRFEDPFSQGFVRGDVIDGRLYVSDGDPRGYQPGIVHVFENRSTPPRATIVDEAIHNFQVIKFGGQLYVSGGLADASSALNRYDAATGHWTVAQRGRVHMRLRYLAEFDGALYATLYAQNDAELVKIDRALNEQDVQLVSGAGLALTLEVQRGGLYVTGTGPTNPFAFRIEPGGRAPIPLVGLAGRVLFDFAELNGVLYAVGCDATKSYLFGSLDGIVFVRLLEWNDMRFGFAPGRNGATNADGRPSLGVFRGNLYIGSSTNGRLYRVD